jgi:c-di-GMP-binding flagellar brake protein YcgR
MDERRKHARYTTTTIVQYRDSIFAGQMDTVTKDVSLGGVAFFTEKKLPVGKVIKLKLFYDGKSPAKVIKARVVWCREFNDKISKGYMSGVTFLR